MINKSTLRFAENISLGLANRGLAAGARANSLVAGVMAPIAQEVSIASQMAGIANYGSAAEKISAASEIIGSAASTAALLDESNSAHGIVLSDHVGAIKQGIQSALYLAKSMARNYIVDITGKVEDALSSRIDGAENPIVIVENGYAGAWNTLELTRLVSNINGVEAPRLAKAPSVFPEIKEEDLPLLLESGSSELQPFINDWVVSVTPAVACKYLNDAYAKGSIMTTSDLRDDRISRIGGRDVVLALLVAGKNLVANIPEGTEVSLNELQRDMALWTRQLCTRIAYEISRRENTSKSGILVVSYPAPEAINAAIASEATSIVVNRDVYQEFLSKGGVPEILIGAMLTNAPIRMDELLAGATMYQNAAEVAQAQLRSTAIANRLKIVRDVITVEVTAAINEDSEDLPVDRVVMHKLLAKESKNIYMGDIEDIACLVQRIVCRVMFEGTDVERILSAMSTFSKKEDNTDPRVAAGAAVLDLLVEWLADQIELSEISNA